MGSKDRRTECGSIVCFIVNAVNEVQRIKQSVCVFIYIWVG